MAYTVLPSIKGPITIPNDDIEYYENEKERGLIFKKGIDPKILIDAIKENVGYRKDIYKKP